MTAFAGQAFAQLSETQRLQREYKQSLTEPPPPPEAVHRDEALWSGGIAMTIVGAIGISIGSVGTILAVQGGSTAAKVTWPVVLAASAGMLGGGIVMIVIGGKRPEPSATALTPRILLGPAYGGMCFSF